MLQSVSRAFLWPGSAGHGRHGEQYAAEQADESDGASDQEHQSVHARMVVSLIQPGHSPIVRGEGPTPFAC